MIDVAIIGAGAAGMTAALYALRAGLKVLIIEKEIYGGQFSIADNIENYPGIENISGLDLSQKIYEQVKKLGCEFLFQEVKEAKLRGKIKTLKTQDRVIECKSIIIASGLTRRKLNCIGENEFLGRGVSFCATCDGSFFKGKNVMVVGSGNTALQYVLYLSKICNKVFLVIRKERIKAEKYLADAAKEQKNVEILYNCSIKEIKGENGKVDKVIFNDNMGEKNVSGIFIAVGYEANNDIYKDQINLDEKGYIISNEDCETNIDGVYAAGDCREKRLRQIITAASDGAIAGTGVINYLLKNKD